jgi:hypothetical protein
VDGRQKLPRIDEIEATRLQNSVPLRFQPFEFHVVM